MKMTVIRLDAASFLQSLFARESSKDLMAGNGAEVKCHKVIFEAHSEVLAAMILSINEISGKIEMKMKDNSEAGLIQLVRYFYGMDLTSEDLTVDITVELFGMAHRYLLTELLNSTGEVLLQKGEDWWTPGGLIELYCQLKNVDDWDKLKEHVLDVMIRLSEQVRSCERFGQLSRVDALELLKINCLDSTYTFKYYF